jgi:hypothetical protein
MPMGRNRPQQRVKIDRLRQQIYEVAMGYDYEVGACAIKVLDPRLP